MSFADNKTRVFISYAREDEKLAKKLYKSIKAAGLNPWLDREEILPGDSWEIKIRENIRASKYFVPLFSSNSVEKRGYIKKEIRQALDIFEEMSPTEIFIIPVRLDNCKIPNKIINKRHIEDLSKDWDKGVRRILESMGVTGQNSSNTKPDPAKEKQINDLLNLLANKNCIPLIGDSLNSTWIPCHNEVSLNWSKEYNYPLKDNQELPRVAQYLAFKYDNVMYPKNKLCEILKGIKIPNFSLLENKNTPYSVLSSLDLPIYITTNYDHCMEEALKSRGKEPVSEFCRWNENLSSWATNAGIPNIFDPSKDYTPSPSKPLVYHLHGDMNFPQSLVLTEKDYFDFLININTTKNALPETIKKKLITNSFLIVGYGFDSIYMRSSLESIFRNLNFFEVMNLTVLTPLNFDQNLNDAEKYFEKYLQSNFYSTIYWQNYFEFLSELGERLDDYKRKNSLK